MKTTYAILLCVCCLSTFAQSSNTPYFQRSYKPYPFGANDQNGFAMLNDGLVSIMAGTYYEGRSSGITIFKVNALGSYLWVKQYDASAYTNERCLSIAKTPHGNYVLTGFMENADKKRELLLICITPSGNILWSKNIVPFSQLGMSHGLHVQVDKNDGSILIAGFASNQDYTEKTGFLMKTDCYGRGLWVNQFQSAGTTITGNDIGEHVTIAYNLSGNTLGYLLTGSGTAGLTGNQGQATMAAYFDVAGGLKWGTILKDQSMGSLDCAAASVYNPVTEIFLVLRNSSFHRKFGITQFFLNGHIGLSRIFDANASYIYGFSIKINTIANAPVYVVGGIMQDSQTPANGVEPFMAFFTTSFVPVPGTAFKYNTPACSSRQSPAGDYFALPRGQFPSVHTYDFMDVSSTGYTMVSGIDVSTGSNPHFIKSNLTGSTFCEESPISFMVYPYLNAVSNAMNVTFQNCTTKNILVTTNPPFVTYLYGYSRACDNRMQLEMEDEKEFSVSAYPNPVSDQLHIELQHNRAGKLRLTNLLGQTVREEDIHEELNGVFSISVSDLKTGIYSLTFITEQGIEGYKNIMID